MAIRKELIDERIVNALISGEDSPEILSRKVRGKLRKKEKLVKESLKGYLNQFHRASCWSHSTSTTSS
jgi:hypothetical protein